MESYLFITIKILNFCGFFVEGRGEIIKNSGYMKYLIIIVFQIMTVQ